MTNVTEDSVTLVAQINPHDIEGEYEFKLVWQGSPPAFRGEPIPGGAQVHQGTLAGGASDQTVSVVMTGLQSGHLYWYVVVATNSDERAKTEPTSFNFHYSGGFPEGVGGAPYEGELPTEGELDVAEERAAQIWRETEAERQRHKAKEQEERQAAERATLAAETAALKRREGEEAAAAKPPAAVPACVVPSLRGHTLRAARRAINKAHCRLGKVSQPHRHRGALIVMRQTPSHGTKLAGQAAIEVVLGRRNPDIARAPDRHAL
ncbi:MAG: hypothetical protein ACHQCH_04800 [Solirubrobacterales bacterium]